MVPTALYQVWVVVFPVDSVSVEHQRPSLLQAGGHPYGELGLGSGDAPGLRHRHDVAPRVQRVSIATLFFMYYYNSFKIHPTLTQARVLHR